MSKLAKSTFWKEAKRAAAHPAGAASFSPRRRLRWAVVGVLFLTLAAGIVDEPRIWNKGASAANAVFSRVPFLEKIKLPANLAIPFHLGLDLQGGTHLVYEADVRNIPESDRASSLEGVRDVIERRVNAYGVAEPIVQTVHSGDAWRVIVELAGVRDVNQAIKMIGETPILEFKEQGEMAQRELSAEELKLVEAYNAEARKHAESVLEKALALETDFAALAQEFSDESAKEQGGDIGFISPDKAEKLVFALDEARAASGTVLNKVVETDDGFEIARVLGTRDGGRYIKASHILLCYKGAERCDKETTKAQTLLQAKELRAKVTAENFAELARDNSTEARAKTSGGDLGWFKPGVMVSEFDKVVLAQKTGAISNIVETKFGYHIIYKVGDRAKQTEYHVQRVLIAKRSSRDPQVSWKTTGLSGKQLRRAYVQFDPNSGEPEVSLQFNDEGKKLFADITGRNVEKFVAIFLDGEAISVPRVSEQILGGEAVITGSFTPTEAKLLAQRLNAGALPVPINLISERTVGASLGAESVQKSLTAGLIGFAFIALFMILYYRLPGIVAVFALIIYSILVLAVFKLIPVTLTLAGIAGFILSLGIAVDANVLIFERLREELRAGKTLGAAIDEGFRRAWSSIRDGNLTTLISAAILFWFSESLIKGFALTLGIGIILSMFSAFSVTRVFLKFVGARVKSPWLF